jgi:uncharacterized membrane protein YecN with MAPEG domain
MTPTVAPIFVGLLALIQIPMTVAVGLRRVRTDIHFLDGGDPVLLRRMRAHGNFTETVPITLIAMLAAEWRGTPPWLIVVLGCSLLCGRALHYVTLLRSGFAVGRAIGMILTFVAMGGFGLCSLWRAGW